MGIVDFCGAISNFTWCSLNGNELLTRIMVDYNRVATAQGKQGKTGNLTLTFSRQGKHREFCCDTGKIVETQENILTVFCYVNVIF